MYRIYVTYRTKRKANNEQVSLQYFEVRKKKDNATQKKEHHRNRELDLETETETETDQKRNEMK